MEDKKILVVFCTRKISDKTEALVRNMKDTAGLDIDITVIENPNGVALTKEYNQTLDSEDAKGKIILFTHDDIEMLSTGWAVQITRMFKEHPEYGIIGVAGSAEFDEGGAWWNYKRKFGQVLHRKDGKSWLTQFSKPYHHDLEEVCVIDGLFMAIEPERITRRFDEENFSMQFYDISFCLDNFLDGNTKIGVTTKINIAHNSVGELKPEWYLSRQKMIEKYGRHFPITVRTKRKGNGKRNRQH